MRQQAPGFCVQNAELPPTPTPPLPDEVDVPPPVPPLVPDPVPPPVPAPPVELVPPVPPPPVPDVPPPVAAVPPPAEVPPVDPLTDVPPEDEDPPDDEEPPPDELDEVVDVDVVVVPVEVVPLPEDAEAIVEELPVGTVSGGAPVVSAEFDVPPQAARPSASTSPAASAATNATSRDLLSVTATRSAAERLHSPTAVRAVVQVLLGELVAPVAESQVLHRPRQLRRRGRERQQHGDRLERLARFTVLVDATRLRLDDHLAPGGRGPHPVLLPEPHGAPLYQAGCRALG